MVVGEEVRLKARVRVERGRGQVRAVPRLGRIGSRELCKKFFEGMNCRYGVGDA